MSDKTNEQSNENKLNMVECISKPRSLRRALTLFTYYARANTSSLNNLKYDFTLTPRGCFLNSFKGVVSTLPNCSQTSGQKGNPV